MPFPSPIAALRRALRRDDRPGRGVQLLCHEDHHDRRGRDARHRRRRPWPTAPGRCGCTASAATPGSATPPRGSWYYEIEAAGFKDNLTDLAAAIGLAQLARAAELETARAAIAARYLRRARGPRSATGAGPAPAGARRPSTPGTCSCVRLGPEAARPTTTSTSTCPGVAGLPAVAPIAGFAASPGDRRPARRRHRRRASTSSRSTSIRCTRGWATGPASSRPPRRPTPARSACRSGRDDRRPGRPRDRRGAGRQRPGDALAAGSRGADGKDPSVHAQVPPTYRVTGYSRRHTKFGYRGGEQSSPENLGATPRAVGHRGVGSNRDLESACPTT